MKALVKNGIGTDNIKIENIAEPVPSDNEVKIKIAYAGICGTDLSIYNDKKRVEPPIIMGHEFSGVITEVGKDVAGWKVGDRVVAETTKEYCGHCKYCKIGQHSLCKERGALGQQVDGVYADYVCQKQEFLHKIPDKVSLLEAALAEPAACAYHAIFDRCNFKVNDKALIIGPGPMGLLVLEMLKSLNVFTAIIGVNGDSERLKLAEKLGADHTAITPNESIRSIVDRFTTGEGFDYVIDCAGFEESIRNAYDSVRTCGTVIQVGIPDANGITLKNYSNVMLKELTVMGSFSHRYIDWDNTLGLVEAGYLKLKPLISHQFTLDEAKEAFEAKGKIKVIFNIHPELDI